jgi:hypothetical protein
MVTGLKRQRIQGIFWHFVVHWQKNFYVTKNVATSETEMLVCTYLKDIINLPDPGLELRNRSVSNQNNPEQ